MISVHELTKRFGTPPRELVAVDHLTFRVDAGEVYGLLGPNGAGKTTTLRMILGLLRPTSGEARVAEYSIEDAPQEVKRHIGFVSAGVGVYPWLTPREMLSFVGDLYGVPPSRTNLRIVELAEQLGVAPFLDQRSGNLSTGQKQRLNLAHALIHDPPVMLLDEPTRGLDVVGTQVIFEYISYLRQAGKAVIVCTHRLDEAERLCDRFGLLHRGRLRHEGSLQEVRLSTGCQTLTDAFLGLLDDQHEESRT